MPRHDVAELLKYTVDQPRDDHGRFMAEGDKAGAAMEHGAHEPGAETRGMIRDLGRRAVAVLHNAASDLAGKIKSAAITTKFSGASPVQGGGIEIRATHRVPPDHSHLASYIQLHPWQVRNPAGQRALAAVHGGLVSSGTPYVPAKSPSLGVAFKNGPQP